MDERPSFHGLHRVAGIREAEARLQEGLQPAELMGRAAAAVADEAARWLRDFSPLAEVALLVGPGNNGGDALLAGLALARQGYRVRAWGVDAILDSPPRAADAAIAHERWRPRPIEPLPGFQAAFEVHEVHEAHEVHATDPPRPAELLIIDGLFGIGLARPLGPPFTALFAGLQRLRRRGCRLLAIDVPSGLDADTGALPGRADARHAAPAMDAAPPMDLAPPLAADVTVTMIGDKPGLRTGLGREVSGRIRLATLQAGPEDPRPAPDGYLIDAAAARRWLPARAIDSHKGSHGDLLIIGGRDGMQGAARLAARGAIAAGAGKVSIAVASTAERAAGPADPSRPETMTWAWRDDGLARFDVVIGGCGLGFAPVVGRWLARALTHRGPLVVDADALSWLAREASLAGLLRQRDAGMTVLTPHPLEAARLLGCDAATVQHDRIAAALTLARQTGSIVVIKGSGTIIADPDGHWAINDSGGPVLATAGTGDLLAGIIGALAARLEPARAACLGVWLHGAAGDAQARLTGPVGTPAAVFAERLPEVWASLLADMPTPA